MVACSANAVFVDEGCLYDEDADDLVRSCRCDRCSVCGVLRSGFFEALRLASLPGIGDAFIAETIFLICVRLSGFAARVPESIPLLVKSVSSIVAQSLPQISDGLRCSKGDEAQKIYTGYLDIVTSPYK